MAGGGDENHQSINQKIFSHNILYNINISTKMYNYIYLKKFLI